MEPHADAPSPHLVHLDERVAVVHKPTGWLVHKTPLDAHETRITAPWLHRHTGQTWLPVHRLDKGTSGLLLWARDSDTARTLGLQLMAGRWVKRYVAWVRGWPDPETGQVDYPLAKDPEQPSAGQLRLPACTTWRTLQRGQWAWGLQAQFAQDRFALLDIQTLTGRRHQIRRHFKHLGHPLVGDATHGKGPLNRAVAQQLGVQRLWLHAWQLHWDDPQDGRPMQAVQAPETHWAVWGGEGLSGLTPRPGMNTED